VTSILLKKLRGAGILALAFLLVCVGVRPALAGDSDSTPADDKTPAAGGSGDDSADKTAGQPAAVPQLQLDDEGPSARAAKKTHHGLRLAPVTVDDASDRPFWKSWVFWAVTGVIVAGAVGAVLYSTSGSRGSLDPCPASVTLSLGCYGAGR